MNKEYKTSLGWNIFILIVSLPLCSLFGWLAYKTMISDPFNLTSALIILPICTGMILMFVFGIVDMFLAKLIVTEEGIRKVNMWGSKGLLFEEVKGIRSDQYYVYVVPKEDDKKVIKISQYYGSKSEWYRLISSKFVDIDREYATEAEEKLLKDKTYGRTIEERVENISQTKKITRYLNYTSWAVAMWLWFYPRPYELATAVGIILPVVSLILVFSSNGLIRVIDVENSPYPSLSSALSMPPLAIMVRVLLDYDILEYRNAWFITILLMPIILLVIVKGARGEFQIKSKLEGVIIYPFLIVTTGLFIFFSSVSINCTFDNLKPELFRATVIRKEISRSNKSGTRYLLTIGSWGDISGETEVSVTKKQFERIEDNTTVNVNLKPGLLSIPWIYITAE